MSDQPQANQTTLVVKEYVDRRRRGMSPDEALLRIQGYGDRLSKAERIQITSLIKQWEASEGANFRPAWTVDTVKTPITTQTVMPIQRSAATVNSVKAPMQPTCPHCGKSNRTGEITCQRCGKTMTVTRATTRVLDGDEESVLNQGTATLSASTRLYLYVRGVTDPIEIEEADEMVIGRATSDSPIRPDIDLSPYQGEEMGVSRLHATLKRYQNTISLTDLDSVNHTFINGQRLHPHEVRVLHDGDEIRMGRLLLKIKFRRNLRRLD